jgi:hypothetical protein
MALTNIAKNAMLDELASVATVVSLHTGDPGTTGANELAGGNPAYARQSISWNAAAGGTLTANSQPTFDVPGDNTVSHFGLWSVGGQFQGGGPLSASEVFAAQGQYTLTSVTVTLTDA